MLVTALATVRTHSVLVMPYVTFLIFTISSICTVVKTTQDVQDMFRCYHIFCLQPCIGTLQELKVTGLMLGSVRVDNNTLNQTVIWSFPATNLTLTGYLVKYWEKDVIDGIQTMEVGPDANSAEILLSRPSAGKKVTYYVTVSTNSSEGEGPPSKIPIIYKSKYKGCG